MLSIASPKELLISFFYHFFSCIYILRFFGLLSMENRKKLIAFCDVDVKKIGTTYHQAYTNLRVPIIHFREAVPPVIICVALDRTGGELEKNLASMNWKEGQDYWHFSCMILLIWFCLIFTRI